VWVSSAAVAAYGGPNSVPLPVPLDFAQAHPGPVEVVVRVLQFSGAASPGMLYSSADYSRLGWPGVTLLNAQGPHGGRVTEIDSAANGGLTEYQYQWTDANNWVEVSVLGASMTESQAQAVAGDVSS
jgi:hypothetical protein